MDVLVMDESDFFVDDRIVNPFKTEELEPASSPVVFFFASLDLIVKPSNTEDPSGAAASPPVAVLLELAVAGGSSSTVFAQPGRFRRRFSFTFFGFNQMNYIYRESTKH